MIIWLASYPRSGNTLCRTILKQTFDLGSYSDDPPEGYLPTSQTVGHLDLPTSFEEFYGHASASDQIFFVKTHKPPRDGQPAILIVRDGRATIVSYHRFHASFHPQKPRSLGQLILGDDHYGDWTGHFRAWMEPGSGRRIMLLRYEDLVAASERVLQQIAGFIGYSGQMRGWVNPFGRLHEQCPDFYRQGNVSWSPTPDWTPAIEALFILFHSALMRELGYLAATPEKGGETLQSEFDASYVKEWKELAHLVRTLVRERDFLDAAGRDYRRQLVDKEAEIASLSAAYAAYRQDLEAKEREIRGLAEAAAARLAVIQQLQASREYKVGVTLLHPWQVLRQRL